MKSASAVTALVLAGAISALACGDKLLHLSRIHRSAAAMHGSVVVFSRPDSLLANAASMRLDAALQKAGHTLRLVSSDRELAAAIRSSAPDVVIADIADVATVKRLASAKEIVVPVVANSDREALHAAKNQFAAVIPSPAKPGRFVDAVEDAMAARLTRQETDSQAQR